MSAADLSSWIAGLTPQQQTEELAKRVGSRSSGTGFARDFTKR